MLYGYMTGLAHTSNKIDSSSKPIAEISNSWYYHEFKLNPNDGAGPAQKTSTFHIPFLSLPSDLETCL